MSTEQADTVTVSSRNASKMILICAVKNSQLLGYRVSTQRTPLGNACAVAEWLHEKWCPRSQARHAPQNMHAFSKSIDLKVNCDHFILLTFV